jgi:hypothetical protein
MGQGNTPLTPNQKHYRKRLNIMSIWEFLFCIVKSNLYLLDEAGNDMEFENAETDEAIDYEDIFTVIAKTDEAAQYFNTFVRKDVHYNDTPTDGKAGTFHWNGDSWERI